MAEGTDVEMNEYDGLGASPLLTPLDEAQELIYQAWEEPTKRERKKLARQALELSADCADAYVILARDNTETLVEALIYYEAGVRAGERAIGEAMFAENAGHFWLILETRSGRHGIAYGTSLPQMLTDAEEALFQIDEVLQELGVVV